MTGFRILAMATALIVIGSPLMAQEPGTISAGGGPLEILSENGIELHQREQLLVARGDVRATQGGITLNSAVLAASYRERDGKREIHRIDAIGDVVIKTDRETITGEKAVYDLDRDLMQVTGDNLRIVTDTQTITARDSLEYWRGENRAVARGDAVAVEGERRLRGDILEAELRAPADDKTAAAGKGKESGSKSGSGKGSAKGSGTKTDDGRPSIEHMRAWGNVLISTPTEIVRGTRGQYDVERGIATIDGSVRITKGENQLEGDRAIVDMKSGVSRLVAVPRAGGSRVKGVFFPEAKEPPARP